MRIRDYLRLIHGEQAGSQTGAPDSRKADDWIKNYLDEKQGRLNELRQQVMRVKDAAPIRAAFNIIKNTVDQDPDRMAEGGRFAVIDPEGLLISTWPTQQQAQKAAYMMPSAKWVDMGADDAFRARYLGKKPKALEEADNLRQRIQTRPRTTAGTGGAAGPGGGTGAGG